MNRRAYKITFTIFYTGESDVEDPNKVLKIKRSTVLFAENSTTAMFRLGEFYGRFSKMHVWFSHSEVVINDVKEIKEADHRLYTLTDHPLAPWGGKILHDGEWVLLKDFPSGGNTMRVPQKYGGKFLGAVLLDDVNTFYNALKEGKTESEIASTVIEKVEDFSQKGRKPKGKTLPFDPIPEGLKTAPDWSADGKHIKKGEKAKWINDTPYFYESQTRPVNKDTPYGYREPTPEDFFGDTFKGMTWGQYEDYMTRGGDEPPT